MLIMINNDRINKTLSALFLSPFLSLNSKFNESIYLITKLFELTTEIGDCFVNSFNTRPFVQ